MKQLEVGDKVAKTYAATAPEIITVERVTQTQAILTYGIKVRREVDSNGSISEIGRDKWSWASYSVATDADFAKERKHKQQLKASKRLTELDKEIKSASAERIDFILNALNAITNGN